MAIVGKDILRAKEILDTSELIAIPTETVYGLAGNCLDTISVARIFEVKNRPYFDPLIAHFSSITQVKKYVKEFPEIAEKLAKKFWPGPLTLLLKKKDSIPDIVTSGLDTVAVRVPDHPLTLKLLKSLDYPLAAPSANPFGYISPTEAFHVQVQLGEKIDYILDGGSCQVGIESTIVGFEGQKVIIHRLGGIPLEEIEAVAGKVELMPHSESKPVAPGMLSSHYAPLTPIIVGNIREMIASANGKKIGVLSFQENILNESSSQFVLSEDGDLKEAAANLFYALRKLDGMGLDIILAELVPEIGLGRAINDRLRRASVKLKDI
jgi:L-threonylcarbamoyladenylate synthase